MNPPTSRPPAVPESGNAKYVLVVVALLLATGGIFAWRSMSNRAATPAPAPPMPSLTASAAPTNPKLDDIPLPPPVEDKPEAGPPRIIYVSASAGCEGKCVGKMTDELEGALKVRGTQARRCYNQALAQDSSLKGHVQIALRVGTAGNVCSANVTSNDMGTPAVANCAANIFRTSGGLPAPHGGCLEVTVPLSFVTPGQ